LCPMRRMTILALDRPAVPFSAGLALRRNRLIVAFSEALVLVASDLKGGSAHAVRWALRAGMPLFAFAARRGTPAGNASLIKAGLATALKAEDTPGEWMNAVLPAIERHARRLQKEIAPASQENLFDPGAI
jgi:predicted Rossmann fold nucleotide-binding protein DprA/Smf involved in DNA uptake